MQKVQMGPPGDQPMRCLCFNPFILQWAFRSYQPAIVGHSKTTLKKSVSKCSAKPHSSPKDPSARKSSTHPPDDEVCFQCDGHDRFHINMSHKKRGHRAIPFLRPVGFLVLHTKLLVLSTARSLRCIRTSAPTGQTQLGLGLLPP